MKPWIRTLRRTVLIAVALAAPAMLPASAQTPPSIFDRNGHPFRTPATSPNETLLQFAPVHVSRGDRDRVVMLAELGDRLGFWIRHDPEGDFELAGAIHARAASRFDLDNSQTEFIEVHFRVGTYLRARYRDVAARLEFYHVSSHLGDEFLVRTGREPIETSREGFELLFQAAPITNLMVYGGPGVLVRSARSLKKASARFGAEWEPLGGAFARPYAGVDGFVWSELDWDPQIAMEAGIALGKNARVGFTVGFGPSRAEQFFREHETLWGLSSSFVR